MSRITFHTQYGSADVNGSERAHFGTTLAGLAWGLIGHHDYVGRNDKIYQLVDEKDRERNLESIFKVGTLGFVVPTDGGKIDAFAVSLNTAIVIGGDVLKFVAHVHGQCEVHGYVEGEDRRWLSQIIESGLDSRVLRRGMGWDKVIELLRWRDADPVVTSYSVTESFPNYRLCEASADESAESWWRLTEADRWRLCMDILRKRDGLRWCPQRWNDLFGTGMTAMHLRQIADGWP